MTFRSRDLVVTTFCAMAVATAAHSQSALPSLIDNQCLAFNKDGTCSVIAGAPNTSTVTRVQTPTASTATVFVPPPTISTPTFQTIPAPVPTTTVIPTPIATSLAPTNVQGVQFIQPAATVTTRQLGIPLTAADYFSAYIANGRFQWNGMNYGNRNTAYSLQGWTGGFETGRAVLYAQGRIGHYTENKSFSYAPTALTVYSFNNVGTVVNTASATMATDNKHNVYEGGLGFRQSLGSGVSSNISLYGRRDDGKYKVTTTEVGSTANSGASSSLTESVESSYIGIRVGAHAAQPISQQWQLRASGGIAPVQATHKYSATQLIGGTTINVNKSIENFGFVADGRVGLEFQTASNFGFNIGGFGSYLSRGLAVDRPDAADPTATELSFDDTYELGASFGFTLGF